jgi:hypothetical protein
MSLLPADLYALGHDLRCAAARRRRRTRRRALVAVGALVATATAAVAVGASTLLGGSAPRAVQIDLGTAVEFALLKHPVLDAHTAHVTATSASATLYSVVAKNGDYCAELIGATHGAIFGFTCSVQQRAANGQFLADAYAPSVSYFDDPAGASPPVVEFGRLPAGTVSARAVFDNGVVETIHPGLDRFFVYEPSPRYQALARRVPLTLEFRDGRNLTWSYYVQPPQPLRIEGRRISGRVLIDHAMRVELDVAPVRGASPSPVFVPIHSDGTFSWTRRPNSVVYRVTVRDARNNPVSADTNMMTLASIRRQFAALQRR